MVTCGGKYQPMERESLLGHGHIDTRGLDVHALITDLNVHSGRVDIDSSPVGRISTATDKGKSQNCQSQNIKGSHALLLAESRAGLSVSLPAGHVDDAPVPHRGSSGSTWHDSTRRGSP